MEASDGNAEARIKIVGLKALVKLLKGQWKIFLGNRDLEANKN
jgi:hypothetical protein